MGVHHKTKALTMGAKAGPTLWPCDDEMDAMLLRWPGVESPAHTKERMQQKKHVNLVPGGSLALSIRHGTRTNRHNHNPHLGAFVVCVGRRNNPVSRCAAFQ